MNLSAFIARRVAVNKGFSFAKYITKLSIGATALSVAVMIISLAIIYGFQGAVANKVFGFWGHIRVRSYEPTKVLIAEENYIRNNDSILQLIRNIPNVTNVHAYATKSAILTTQTDFDGILMKGIHKAADTSVYAKFLLQGRCIHYNDTSFSKEILMSKTITNNLNIKLNDAITVYFFDKDAQRTRAKRVQVVGIYSTDIEEYDRNFIIGDINLIRDLNNWDSTLIGGYEIMLHNVDKLDETNTLIKAVLRNDWQSKSIKEEYSNIFDWLQLLNTNKYVLLIIMTIVAAINLITCFIILVLERIRMIGILKALGNSASSIRSIFLFHTLYIGIMGISIGAVVGWLCCILQQYTGVVSVSNAEAYSITTIPISILWWHIPLVCIGTAIICSVVLLIPAYIINKIKPVAAIQFQ